MIRESGMDPQAITVAANKQIERAQSHITQILNESPNDASAPMLRRILRETFGDAEAHGAKDAGKAYDAFEAGNENASAELAAQTLCRVDQVKRSLQRFIAKPTPANAGVRDILSEDIETPLRTFLEDPKQVGEGPAMFQTIRNRGWSDKLNLQQGAGGKFPFLTSIEGNPSPDAYFTQQVGDRDAIQSIVEMAGDPAKVQKVQQLADWSQREAQFMQALTKHLPPSDPMVKDAANAALRAKAIRDALANRTAEGAAAANFKRVTEVAPPPPSAMSKAIGHIPYVGKALHAGEYIPSAGTRAQVLQTAENTLARPDASEAAQTVARSGMSGVHALENTMRNMRALKGSAPSATTMEAARKTENMTTPTFARWLGGTAGQAVGEALQSGGEPQARVELSHQQQTDPQAQRKLKGLATTAAR
jgi:hypothetical protein